MPGYWARPDLPTAYDPYFDPYWSRCVELGLPVAIHAGYGQQQCEFLGSIEGLQREMEAAGRTDLLAEIINNAPRFFQKDLRPRRAMWQLMFGGVFDRHPRLRLLMTEVRGDWLPETLQHLDAAYEQVRDDVPARTQAERVLARALPDDLVVRAQSRSGDAPRARGRHHRLRARLPARGGNVAQHRDWLRDAFAGVPDDELRLMLGENVIRVLGLDRAKLAAVAARIGPTIDDVTGRTPDLDPRLVANWDARGGYLKPPEQHDPEGIDALLVDDLQLVASRS